MQRILTLSFLVLLIAWIGVISVFATNSNIQLRSVLPYAEQVSDVWGYNDVTGEYALVGTNSTFSIVNVSEAGNPIELHSVSGPSSTWRDIKTWQNYAYVTNETAQGILIVDMAGLPGNIQTYDYYGDANAQIITAHNIYIDEFGFAYIFGSNWGAGGVVILDLNVDPINPPVVGVYDDQYVHDGYALDNKLYVAEIYTGMFNIIDVTDKSNLVVLGGHETTGEFTHNIWSSDDNNYAFTTDEIGGGFVDAYDVSDPTDIVRVDFIQSSPGMGVIPHNTHWLDNFLVTSYYKDGITIHDASLPSILVEVGNYDTFPEGTGGGFDGAWGAYPFLDSGLILASDMSNGLYVLEPTYVPAAYLTGAVTSANTGIDLSGVNVEVLSTALAEQTDLAGEYGTGTVNAGIYDVYFSKLGFNDTTLFDIELVNGQITNLDIALTEDDNVFVMFGQVKDITDDSEISEGEVTLSFFGNEVTVPIQDGFFTFDQAPPTDFDVLVTSWGYYPTVLTIAADSANAQPEIYMTPGYYDDYASDLGWSATGSSYYGGEWELAVPQGFNFYGQASSPQNDNADDIGDKCYTTGEAEQFDLVVDGTVVLESPEFDISNYTNPYMSFWSFFANFGQYTTMGDDYVRFYLNNGTDDIQILEENGMNTPQGIWAFHNFKISDFLTPSSTMTFRVEATADAGQELVESALDVWHVIDSANLIYDGIAINDVATTSQSGTDYSVSTAYNDNIPCTPYYSIGDYDDSVFSNVEIDNDGNMTFDVNWGVDLGNYTIPYTFYCNTFVSYTGIVYINVETDVEETIVESDWSIFPNPAKDQVSIHLAQSSSAEYTYAILDLQGKVVSTESIYSDNVNIDLSKLTSGLYLLELREGGRTMDTKKLIIE